jgi:hypothetical protein
VSEISNTDIQPGARSDAEELTAIVLAARTQEIDNYVHTLEVWAQRAADQGDHKTAEQYLASAENVRSLQSPIL